MKDYETYEASIESSFKSDGCTFAPDGSWGSCCIIHDHAKRNKAISNKQADELLLDCMKDRANPVLAYLYFSFVRIQSSLNVSPFGLMSFTVISVFVTFLYFKN